MGGVEGLVRGADLVFLSKTNSTDYHDEMNSKYDIEWLTEQLLPTLEGRSVIVLDNTSYHNKQQDKYQPTVTGRTQLRNGWTNTTFNMRAQT